MEPQAPDVTRLLEAWEGGDRAALSRLVPAVYRELKKIARGYLARERRGHTLQATALVNEAYLRLVDQQRVHWQSRAHFFAIAATQMRRILVSHARRRQAARRGGGALTVTLDDDVAAVEARGVDLLALDAALDRLAALEERQARVVELRYFAGLTIEETAALLEVAPATVKLDWSVARAWLFRELGGEPG